MKERPILFSGAMVRAILEGKKSQTRRVIKPPPSRGELPLCRMDDGGFQGQGIISLERRNWYSPYGTAGDRMWVRECWYRDTRNKKERVPQEVIYAATPELAMNQEGKPIHCTYLGGGKVPRADAEKSVTTNRWWVKKPSIHMPRWACRLILQITSLRVERLQEITEKDSLAEGFERYECGHPDCEGGHYGPRGAFMEGWNNRNEKRGYGWDRNPMVWVVSFKVL